METDTVARGVVELHAGDCLDVLKRIPESSVDSVVTDPPYGLAFMGKAWDRAVPPVEVWRACLRVLKPGGHLLAFAGTRTHHRMAAAIEDGGFEIRDMIAWVYSSGFPKSLDVSKAIDNAAGAKRAVVGQYRAVQQTSNCGTAFNSSASDARGVTYAKVTLPATADAVKWNGWGTALKPAMEPITLARKPLAGTVKDNVLKFGTGAINVDACRVGTEPTVTRGRRNGKGTSLNLCTYTSPPGFQGRTNQSRWPANFIHDGGEELSSLLGDATRFFYCPKATKRDRNEGLDELPPGNCEPGSPSRNNHPTVKPTELMRYLCRLVTPPGGLVLDPFMGSGSTGKAAMLEGFRFCGIEKDSDYVAIAKARIAAAMRPL
jgi:DNA modification methylase